MPGCSLSPGLGGQIWRHTAIVLGKCLCWSGPWTHSWELDPYLLLLSYLFTSVVCQILCWAVGAGWRSLPDHPTHNFRLTQQSQAWPRTACAHPAALGNEGHGTQAE